VRTRERGPPSASAEFFFYFLNGGVETRKSSSKSVVLVSFCIFTWTMYSVTSNFKGDLKFKYLVLRVCIVVK
jgi:hypothetical protein